MELPQEDEFPTRQITLDPDEHSKLLVACYRVYSNEPLEPATFTDRIKPSIPRVRVGFWHDPQLPLLCGLGMPGKIERVLIIEPGRIIDKKYDGLTVELFGVRGAIPDDVMSASQSGDPDIHWNAQHPERGVKPDGLSPGGYAACQQKDTKEIIEMHVWRHRVYLDDSPIYMENLWSATSGWVPMICGMQFVNYAKAAAHIKRLSNGILLGFLAQEELNKETRGGARYSKFPYFPGQKVALSIRYKEIIEEYQKVCKSRKMLLRDHSDDTVRAMIESGFAALNIPPHVMDRLLDINSRPSDKSARPLALEHAAMETLRDYTPWLYNEDDLLYLEREGEKLHKNGMPPASRNE